MESTISEGKHQALHVKLTGSRFDDVCLGDAEFENVSLVRARMYDVNLSDMNVSCFQMGGSTFSVGGSHPKRNQKPITFHKCELVGTSFTECDLSDTHLTGCRVDGMTIDGIPVSEAIAAYKKSSPTNR